MAYTNAQNAAAALGAVGQFDQSELQKAPKPDPALTAAVTAINRQLTYAHEAVERLVCAVDRMRPPSPTAAANGVQMAADGTLLMALAQIENRVAYLALVLGDTAGEVDRLV